MEEGGSSTRALLFERTDTGRCQEFSAQPQRRTPSLPFPEWEEYVGAPLIYLCH